MATTQADLDALDEAIASGTLQVRFADRQVTYRSLDEMLRIRARMDRALNGAGTRRVKIAARSGWR